MINNKLRFADPIGWLRDCIKRLGIGRALGRYYGVYRAEVIDNDDDQGRGRIRLFVPALGHVKDTDSPTNIWALPTTLTAGNGGSHGLHIIPDVGDYVWVMFEDGRTHLPLYFTGWIPRDAPTSSPVTKGAGVKGMFTKTGHRIELNDDDGSVLIQRGDSSTMISLTSDGFDDKIVISNSSGSNVFITAEKTTIFGSDGSHASVGNDGVSLVNSTGSYLSLKGGDINLGCSGSVVISAGKKISLKGSTDIGNGPLYEPAVLGAKMATAWQTHTHLLSLPTNSTAPNAVAPPLLPVNQLSGQVRIS